MHNIDLFYICVTGASGQGKSNGEKLLQLAQSMAAKQLDDNKSEEGDPVNALLLYHSILQVTSSLPPMLNLNSKKMPICTGTSASHVLYEWKSRRP